MVASSLRWADGIAPKPWPDDDAGCYRPGMTTITQVPEPRRKILDQAMPEIYRSDRERGFYSGNQVLTLEVEGRGFLVCECQMDRLCPDPADPDFPLTKFVWVCNGRALVCTGCGADGT